MSTYSAEPLDPWLMCGPDTSVQELWRVCEERGADVHFHLVFFDRYGWYCEHHGPGCAAVGKAREVVRAMAAVRAPKPVTNSRRRKERNRG